MIRPKPIAALAFVTLLLAPPSMRAAFPQVALKPVCLQQLHSPTTIAFAPDGSGRLFFCDQPGKIYIFRGGMLLPAPFLDLSSRVVAQNAGYSEGGLLGLAFHPGYATPSSPGYGRFYVNYNKPYVPATDPPPPGLGDPTPNCVTMVSEFQVSASDSNVATLASERVVLAFTQPQANHNGGQLEFGPDGFLYIGSGDGGGSDDNNVGHTGGNSSLPTNSLGNAQDKTRYLGKILRIDPLDPDGAGPLAYSIPLSNPFISDGTPGVKKEIYALGLRNPWRFSFDKRPGGTNRLFCGDVGQGRIEEIDLIVSGGNYGWRYKEGTEFPSFSSGAAANPMTDPGGVKIDPIAMYAHPGTTGTTLPQLGLSVTGGYVYRGAAIPALQGKYLFGDYGSTAGASDGRLMGLEENAPGSGMFTLTEAVPLLARANPIVGQRILCLGEDESGEIYVGMKTNAGVLQLDNNGFPAGGIYKVVPVQSSSTTLLATKDNTIFSNDEDLTPATYKSDGQGYLYVGRIGDAGQGYLRRALISFDVAGQIPAGAVIQTAQVQLNNSRAGSQAIGTTLALHKVAESWGEGTSNAGEGGTGVIATAGDATWFRRFYNTSSWAAPGGTYDGTPSATTILVSGGLRTWGPTTQLRADVQNWVNAPTTNTGWILIGNEDVKETACRFDSVQKGTTRPKLLVTYDVAAPLSRRESWLQQYFPVGLFVDDAADLDGDGIANLLEYAYSFSPLAQNASDQGLQMTARAAGASTQFTVTFRRDPRATDLTYRLQVSGDLASWTTIVQSVAGTVSNGTGFVSETDAPGESPIKVVTASETVSGATRRFARLQVLR